MVTEETVALDDYSIYFKRKDETIRRYFKSDHVCQIGGQQVTYKKGFYEKLTFYDQ